MQTDSGTTNTVPCFLSEHGTDTCTGTVISSHILSHRTQATLHIGHRTPRCHCYNHKNVYSIQHSLPSTLMLTEQSISEAFHMSRIGRFRPTWPPTATLTSQKNQIYGGDFSLPIVLERPKIMVCVCVCEG